MKPKEVHAVGDLAAGLRDQGMALSVLAGVRPGVVVVNDDQAPTALFIGAPEGGFAWTYLAGDRSDRAFREELRTWLFEEHGLGSDVAFSFLTCDSPEWEDALPGILAPRTVIPDRRLHYECTKRPPAWQEAVPNGYRIADLDRALLDSDVGMHPQIEQWMTANFGSTENFLQRGVGAVAVHEGSIVGWILADSFVDGLSDIGGEIEEAHRRKGLACTATCRTLELALDRGAERVGWHCHAINVPSIKTAETAGFELKCAYTVYPIQFDPEKHEKLVAIVAGEYVEAGNAAIAAGDYAKADEAFAKMLRLIPEAASDVFHSAARAAAGAGESNRAFELLSKAVERGWCDATQTTTQPEFVSLHQDPRWPALVDQLEKAG
ncbi:MAG: GNAT family N-acetyltransferase [Candidatus Bipolaricaulia bacterium]